MEGSSCNGSRGAPSACFVFVDGSSRNVRTVFASKLCLSLLPSEEHPPFPEVHVAFALGRVRWIGPQQQDSIDTDQHMFTTCRFKAFLTHQDGELIISEIKTLGAAGGYSSHELGCLRYAPPPSILRPSTSIPSILENQNSVAKISSETVAS